MAAAYLGQSGYDAATRLAVARRNAAHWDAVLTLASRQVNSPVTSSAGRLFDAAAAILGVRDEINYEGQAAIELEQLAAVTERAAYLADITPTDPFTIDGTGLIRALADDLLAGISKDIIAARFHNGIAALIEGGCVLARERTGLTTVALSGGVFQNQLLLRTAATRLEERGFAVLLHSQVPCNDGGISLGQAAVAAAADRAATT
jgi:hydrogenase maturation protein HypF